MVSFPVGSIALDVEPRIDLRLGSEHRDAFSQLRLPGKLGDFTHPKNDGWIGKKQYRYIYTYKPVVSSKEILRVQSDGGFGDNASVLAGECRRYKMLAGTDPELNNASKGGWMSIDINPLVFNP